MNLFDLLNMLFGLSIFLFGMSLMGNALEKQGGTSFHSALGKITNRPLTALLTGLGVTALIQSSSATTVMVVGLVSGGLLTLRQSIYIIMGANIGTTVTAWLLSLAGIKGQSLFFTLINPDFFLPILSLFGIIFYLFYKSEKKKNIGVILLGFSILMMGMNTMTASVEGLKNVPSFVELFTLFENPFYGVLAGAILTAVIQSSSASIGILQALAATGNIYYASAIPIIMGQNIGTCVTALISGIGADKNGKRAALVHLAFNILGTAIILTLYLFVRGALSPSILKESASFTGIASCHSIFNILSTLILYPFARQIEKLVLFLIPQDPSLKKPEAKSFI